MSNGRPGICLVCGFAAGLVEGTMVEWIRPAEGVPPFGMVDRCLDRRACRARVHSAGKLWPINDGTPAPEPAGEEVPEWL